MLFCCFPGKGGPYFIQCASTSSSTVLGQWVQVVQRAVHCDELTVHRWDALSLSVHAPARLTQSYLSADAQTNLSLWPVTVQVKHILTEFNIVWRYRNSITLTITIIIKIITVVRNKIEQIFCCFLEERPTLKLWHTRRCWFYQRNPLYAKLIFFQQFIALLISPL